MSWADRTSPERNGHIMAQTTSRVPSAVVPTNTILSRNAPAGTWSVRTSAAEKYGNVRFFPR